MLQLLGIEADDERLGGQVEVPPDAALGALRLQQAGGGAQQGAHIGGPGRGRGQAHQPRKATDEIGQLGVAGHTHVEGFGEIGPVGGGELGGVVLEALQNGVDGPDGVVDFVGHHPNQLLIGLLFLPDELLRQLLEHHEAAGEAPVEEVGGGGAVGSQAREAQRLRLALGQGGQGRAPGPGQRGGQLAGQPGGRRADEAGGGGIGAFDAALKIENENAGRRGLNEALQQHAFLVLAHALAAQGVNHLVVHADELVHLALAHGHELQAEILGLHGRRARRDELKRPHESPVQLRSEHYTEQQQHLTPQKQRHVGGAQLGRHRNQHGMYEEGK